MSGWGCASIPTTISRVRSLKALAVAIVAAVGLTMAGPPAVATEAIKVAVVTASPASEPAVRYLATQIDLPTVRRTTDNARRLEQLAVEARTTWKEDLVVVVDAEHAKVSVIRPSDGTISSRTLNARAASAPYAVALAAVELLEIVRNAAPAQSAPVRPARAPAVQLNLAFDAGFVLSGGISGGIVLVEPTAGGDLELLPAGSPVLWVVGIHGSGLIPVDRDFTLVIPGFNGPGKLDYQRDELSLRLGIGHREGPSAVFGWGDVGFAFIRLHAQDQIFTAVDRRTAIWLGVGAELRYTVVGSFALGLGAGLAFLPVASRFFASPPGSTVQVTALREDSVDLRARASLLWEFAP